MKKNVLEITHSRWAYLLALFLGLIQAFSFDLEPHSAFVPLGLIANLTSLLGFLALICTSEPKRAMKLGYLFGLGAFSWGLNWVYISMATFGGAPLAFAIAANGAVCAYLALYWLLGAYAISKLGKTRQQRLLLAPAVIALLEWVRSVFLIGFPWLSIGYAYIDSKLALLAAYGGVFFVSFIAVALASALLLYGRWVKLGILLCLAVGYFIPLPDVGNAPQNQTKSANVALVQGNMPVILTYNNERMAKNLVQYHLLTDSLLKKQSQTKPDVVIWPESAIPYFYVEAMPFLRDIQQLQRQHHFDLITGVPHVKWDTKAIFNSVLLQKENNMAHQFYNKSHLLPFGEYIPLRGLLAFFKDFVTIPMADFAHGETEQKPFQAGGLTFSLSVCYEAVFGDEIRRNAQHAEVLLNLSNDAWFERSKAQPQHLNIARMRAIENGKTLIRATNNGRTAIVNARGEIVKSIPPFKEGVLESTVYASTNNPQTLYSQFGDKLVIFLSVIMIAFTLGIRRVERGSH